MWAVTGCHAPGRHEPSESHTLCLPESFVEKLELVTPQVRQVSENLNLTGSVEPNPDRTVHFTSLVEGFITQVFFSLGEPVRQGQILAEIRSPQLADLEAQSRALEAQVRVAQRQLQSVEGLARDGIASQKEVLEAQSALDILLSEQEKNRAILQMFSASKEKGVFLIKAPMDGYITEKNITPGMAVSSGSGPLFTVADLTDVWVMVNVFASHVTRVQVGTEVRIRTLSYPDQTFKGTVSALSQVLDPEARVVKARVVVPNPGLLLKPGMRVDVTAIRRTETQALCIPNRVMIFDNNQNYVVVYKSPCDQEIRPLEVIQKFNDSAFVASGLNPGDQIVARNQLLLYEKLKNFLY